MSQVTIAVRRAAVLAAAVVATIAAPAPLAQVKTNVPDVVAGARPATVERLTIHAAALEGNLEGDTVDREAIVFLPPGYNQNRTRRYPVVYALHGYSIGAEQWTQEIHVPQTIEGAFAKGAHEMIVVLPDSKTVHNCPSPCARSWRRRRPGRPTQRIRRSTSTCRSATIRRR